MRDPLSRISVKYKLALGFVGLCVIAFGAGGQLISNSARGTLEDEILSRLEFQCQAYATDLHSGLATLMRRSEDFASDGYIRDHLSRIIAQQNIADEHLLNTELLRHLKVNKLPLEPAFINLTVLSNDGAKAIASEELGATRLTELGAWSRGLTSSMCSRVYPGSPAKPPLLFISTPIYDLQDGQPIGHLLAGIRSGLWIAQAMRTDRLGRDRSREDVSLRLLDGRGQVLEVPAPFLNYRKPPAQSAPILEGRGLLVSTTPNTQLTANANTVDSRLFIRSYPIGETGWSAEVSIQAASALAPVSGLQTEFLVVGAVIALLALLVLYFPLRFLASPLIELRKAALKIRQGDFSPRVIVETQDEVGDLAHSFNLMASAIESRTHELEQQAKLLKLRQAEARSQRDRLDRVISAMQDGLVVLDDQGEVVLSNHAAGDMLKILASEKTTSKRLATSHIPCAKEHRTQFSNCASCLSGAETGAFSCLLDIGERVFEIHATSLPSNNHGKSGRILVSRDVTDRVSNDERQVHQERLAVLGEVAAVMAHELNNPLASISLFNQMLQSKLPSDSELQENVDVIERNTETCKRVISELLGYAAKGEPAHDQLSVHDVLDDVLRFLRPIAERRQVALKSDFLSGDVFIAGDEVQIRQVIVNLVMNAVQAIEGGGMVVLATEIIDDSVHVKIIDNGSGIPEDKHQEIFRPFFTTKALGDGTGLGLSTSVRITEIHGGSLELISSTNAGTEFQVRLPLSKSKA